MPYKRTEAPVHLLRGDDLTAALAGIGMGFAAAPMDGANIEDTLLALSVEALEHDDLRLLAVLTTWLRIHYPRINADRLLRVVRAYDGPRVRAFWAAVGRWLGKDRRLARLATLYHGPRLDLLSTGTDFLIRRSGENERLKEGPLRVPANVLRDRDADVLTPSELAQRHPTYRYRVLIEPSYRADMWAALQQDPSLPAAEIARRAYGSFATAWQVKHDQGVLGTAPLP